VRNDSGNEFNYQDPDLGNDELRVLSCTNQGSTQSRLSEWVDGTSLYSGESITVNSSTGGWTWNGIAVLGRDRNGSPQLRRLNGAISELILFEGALSTANRQLIEGYLSHRYWGSGQANRLPSTHPYKTTNPYTSSYLLGTDITCASTYGLSPSVSYGAAQGEQITFYLTRCQNPGTLTVELTVA